MCNTTCIDNIYFVTALSEEQAWEKIHLLFGLALRGFVYFTEEWCLCCFTVAGDLQICQMWISCGV